MTELLAAAVLAAATPSFAFGTVGGNIRPLSASIARSGRVLVDGSARPAVSRVRLTALDRLARAQAFFALPARIACSGVLPDVASRYVRVSEAGRTWKVTVHGGCDARFNRIYGALARAAGLPA